jgi:tetratricopeptide (TPR) repeat protein
MTIKKNIFGFLACLNFVSAFANINYINIKQISSDEKYLNAFEDIKANQQYINHWTPNWDYEIPKETLISKLKEHYTFFSTTNTKNVELSLLLADICHYLYNLDDGVSHKKAIDHYNEAIQNAPQDYRCYWFLGNHHAFSNQIEKAIANYKKAEKQLPKDSEADFWNEYAFAASLANMPTHSIYAMDKARGILGKPGYFEETLGKKQRETIKNIDKQDFFKKEELWKAIQKDNKFVFMSRPLGMKIAIDSTWKIAPQDYKKTMAFIVLNPTPIKNKKGHPTSYTIAIIVKTAEDKDNLEPFINSFTQKYEDKTKISFSEKYDKMIAYEIKEKNMYQNMGGGHLYTIGIERNEPKYAGLAIEEVLPMPKQSDNNLKFLKAGESKNRFKGKIFYSIILDASEDIHDEALITLKRFFEENLTIE